MHPCSVSSSPAFSVNNHSYVYEESRRRQTTPTVKRQARYTVRPYVLSVNFCHLTSGVVFLNSRLRSISFFLDCSLSSCLLASCVAVASSSFCNANAHTEKKTCYFSHKYLYYHSGCKDGREAFQLNGPPKYQGANDSFSSSLNLIVCCCSSRRGQTHNTFVQPRKALLHCWFDV